MEIKRVALVGLGAIGSYLAPRLEAALGHGNFLVVASGERRARLEREGTVINGETYHFTVADPAEGAVLPADLVIFAVKWPQLAQAVEDVRPLVGEDTALLSLLNSGVVFRDTDGNPLGDSVESQGKAFMTQLADAGVNWVRLRVWNDPYDAQRRGYGGGNNDLNAALQMGQWATEAGLQVLIDFHYSDFWADPGKQQAPKAWKDMTVDEKTAAVSTFTTESLRTLLHAGVNVGMVQIGNETNNGIAGVLYETDGWGAAAQLFAAGVDAAHAVAAESIL